jgi:peptidoglycan/xylan/chitin deacetylase (PgdA/CDA1 family)
MKAVMYHYVRNPSTELPHLKFLHFDNFRKQLDFFDGQFGIATVDEFTKFINGNQQANDKIILTFDDGLKDHYEFVFPELKARELTAFFYVSTGVLDSDKLLSVHRLHVLLGKYGGKKIYDSLGRYIKDSMLNIEHTEKFKNNTYNTQDNDWYSSEIKRIFNYYIDYSRQKDVLDKMMDEFFPNETAIAKDFYLNEAEIKEMSVAGMVFGGHTVHHFLLSKCDAVLQDKEITGSVKRMERTAQVSTRTFCYPYGGTQSYNDDTIAILKNASIDFAFSVGPKDIDNNILPKERLYLPRYDCNYFPHGKAWGP